jgi:DNA repair exonuclease SbcCD ATPase subunit
MKYITFKKLVIKNFLSVGEEPVEVSFNKGLNIITGINKDKVERRNGVGKSTIADALYFSVFGDTLRELKKEHIINNVTQNKCEVVLYFTVNHNDTEVNYKIVRTLGPTKCYIYKDDIDVTRDSISNTNQFISSILSSSPDVFQNCIIMTVNNTTPFMAKKRVEKRKFIEGILNLEVFGDMLSTIRSEYNEVMNTFDKECTKFEEVSSALQTYKEQKEAADKTKQTQSRDLQERKEENNKKIEKLKVQFSETEIPDVEGLKNTYSELEEKTKKINDNQLTITRGVTKLETRIAYNEKLYNRLGTEESTCPVCLRSMSDHDKDKIDEEKKAIQDKISKFNSELKQLKECYSKTDLLKDKINKRINRVSKEINNASITKNNIDNIKQRIDDIIKTNSQLDSDIEKINSQDNQFDELISKVEIRIDKIQAEITNIKALLHTLDIVKFVVSEEGVKSYIVKKILQLLNGKLAYYLKKMDSNCICVFNEYFEEQIIDEKGKVCSYFNFSGAERKNIDLACLFAFMDIRRLQGDVAFNFSIYDELFDSSLDEKGVELVIRILKERIEKYNECVMVISHRKESAKLASGEIIFLEKSKGITRRVDNLTVAS